MAPTLTEQLGTITAIVALALGITQVAKLLLMKYNAGIVFKRALGQGRITRITGLREYLRKYGDSVVEEQLLKPGTMRRNWKQTLLSHH